MYHLFFGLQEPAFAIAVNPRYLYMSEQHREALAHLLFGLRGGGFVQLTGEVGTGKTTIIRCLLEQLPEDTDIALVLNPMTSVPELLSTICDELGARYIADDPTIKSLTDSLHNKLLSNHQRGRKTVLLIDEAQLLSAEALEQIRLLTNLETHTEKLLNIILVGQPELNDLLAKPSLRQLAQRITARFHLHPLSQAETAAYIQHRLRIAGWSETQSLIPQDIQTEVHRFSGGVPRLINILCERMLLGAYGKNRTDINRELFEQARREITGEPTPSAPGFHHTGNPLKKLWGLSLAAGLAGVLLGALLFGWYVTPDEEPPVSEEPSLDEAETLGPIESSAIAQDSGTEPAEAEPFIDEAPAPAFIDLPWPRHLDQARRQIADALSLQVPAADPPCHEGDEEGHVCRNTQLDTWNALIENNRPGVMTLMTPERKLIFAPLLGLDEDRALLWLDGAERAFPWADLARHWTGRFHYYTFQPPGFDGSLGAGEESPAVAWLAEQFAQLDGERSPLAEERYNIQLQARVEIFQRRNGLIADGLFGENTLNVLAQELGLDPKLLPMPEAP